MKKSNIKYEVILDIELIKKTYDKVCRNTKHKEKLLNFEIFKDVYINKIYTMLYNENYIHGKYNIFLVKDPKYRIVMSENIIDKVINNLICDNFLKPVLLNKLIDQNVSNRVNMGTDKAIKYCKKYLEKNKYKEKLYVLKYDIKKYFYNIDHNILINMLDHIFIDKRIIRLISVFLYSTNDEYINQMINKLVNKEKEKNIRLDELNKIPLYKNNKGLGIGSVSNQIYALFYLNDLDHYIKENLKVKYYIRYMDDGIIFANDYDHLLNIMYKINKYLKKYKLELNRKTKIYNVRYGFGFVGYNYYIINNKIIINIRNKTKRKIKKVKRIESLVSYNGFLKYCSSKYLKYFYVDKYMNN